jgi:hypothetical protein
MLIHQGAAIRLAIVKLNVSRDVRVGESSLWTADDIDKINKHQTKWMQFSVSPVSPQPPSLYIEGTEIEQVRTFRYLGITYDEKLSWSDHTRLKCLAHRRAVSALRPIFGNRRGADTFRQIYSSQVFPRLTQ